MELRSTRSRSKTPFEMEKIEIKMGNHIEKTVVRTTRSSTYTSEFLEENTNVSSQSDTKLNKPKHLKTTKKLRNKTSDYSSEEGDSEISSTRSISENEKNQMIEDARIAANGSSDVSALGLYRKAGRYWDVYPKTDWTYSQHSKDRVEIAPGVVAMPNMSRRSLHSQDCTDHFLIQKESHSQSYARQRTPYISNNYESRLRKVFVHQETTTWTKRVISMFLSMFSVFYYFYVWQSRGMLWIGKKIHRSVSKIMLLDTWLLIGDQQRKLSRVLLLCLVPLLLFGGWWLFFALGRLVYPAFANSTQLVPPITKESSNIIGNLHSDVSTDGNEQLKLLVRNYEELSSKFNEYDSNSKLVVEELREEIERLRIELNESDKSKEFDLKKYLQQIRAENEIYKSKITRQLNSCCRRNFINIESHVLKVVRNAFTDPNLFGTEELTEYFKKLFIAKDELETRLSNLTQHLNTNLHTLIETNAEQIMSDITSKVSSGGATSLTVDNIKRIVNESLAIYDADKTGLVDYAMEPMGGQVLSTRCTESYQSGTAVLSILGIPLWYPSNTPRTVITPGINPGECWAFRGFPGFLVVKLATPIEVTAFSYEHISRRLVPGGRIDSAPRDFEVYGLRNESDKEGMRLAKFRYDAEGEPLQFFGSEVEGVAFELVEIRIESNHGNMNYTCLYRFRVHGKPR